MYHECRHIMPSGRKCHSPALQNQVYCYYHDNLHRYSSPEAKPTAGLFPVEDHRGIQIALTQVLTALNSPYMDTRRAGLMLSGLRLATQLANRISDSQPKDTVRVADESSGEALAPEKIVCEPAHDCRNCPKQETCEDYEDPDAAADDSEDYEEPDPENEDEGDEEETDEEEGDEEKEYEEEEALIDRALVILGAKPNPRGIAGKPK
jgi:hypothetical protein